MNRPVTDQNATDRPAPAHPTGTDRQSGRVAVITGGSRGIGAAVVRRLAGHGVQVVFGYRADHRAASRLVEELTATDAVVEAVAGDLTDPASARALVDTALDCHGRVDIAVSNAGIEHFGALSSITPDDFRRVFDVNVAGQLFFVQAAAASMAAGGRIVMMSSISGRLAVREHALYGASKAAVSALARNLAPELGERGITVNAVAPGGTETDMGAENGPRYTHPALRDVPPDRVLQSMTSAARWARPEEIAAVIEFLVSPEASYVSGSTVDINGGWIG